MRRTFALAASFALLLTLMVAPTPAVADELPPPPKVNPVYDLPSTWPGGTLSEEEALLRKHEISLAKDPMSMKWWSRPVNLSTVRGLGAAGSGGLAGFSLGFGIGNEGVQVVASMMALADEQGHAPDWYCRNVEWYQGSTIGGIFSNLSDMCAPVPFADPNVDVPEQATFSFASGGFFTRYSFAGGNYQTAFCGPQTQLPAGETYAMSYRKPNGFVEHLSFITYRGTFNTYCGRSGLGYQNLNQSAAGYDTLISVRRVVQATGATLETATFHSANPSRETRCTYRFKNGTSKSSAWVPFRDSDGWPAAAFGAACDTLGSTLSPAEAASITDVDVDERLDGGTTHTIATSPVPDEMDSQRENMAGGRKPLTLTRTLGGVEVDCLQNGAQCRDWWVQSVNGTNEEEYRCYYGGVRVALTECAVYAHSFQPGISTPTITDPVTGEQIDWGGQTNPGNSINPGTGPGTSPGDQCMASWASVANPLEWVFRPIQCALVWAFVPRAQKMTQAQTTAQSTFNASLPGRLAGALGAVSPALLALHNGDCGGLILPTPDIGAGWSVVVEDRAFLAACPGDFFAPFAPWFFWFITGSIGIAGFFAIRRYLDKFVGNT